MVFRLGNVREMQKKLPLRDERGAEETLVFDEAND
jgi:hypothetical protein